MYFKLQFQKEEKMKEKAPKNIFFFLFSENSERNSLQNMHMSLRVFKKMSKNWFQLLMVMTKDNSWIEKQQWWWWQRWQHGDGGGGDGQFKKELPDLVDGCLAD